MSHQRQEGHAQTLRVFLGEADQWHDEPLYEAIVKKLRMLDIAGAMSAIDSAEKIDAAAEAIEGLPEDGLIVISEAEIVRLVRSQESAEAPDATGSAR